MTGTSIFGTYDKCHNGHTDGIFVTNFSGRKRDVAICVRLARKLNVRVIFGTIALDVHGNRVGNPYTRALYINAGNSGMSDEDAAQAFWYKLTGRGKKP